MIDCNRCRMNNNCVGFDDCPYLRIKKLEDVIRYTLSISLRQHGDDYPYDDCWIRMREVLEE